MSAEIELAWIAGFFDGEGYVGVEKNQTTLAIQIAQVRREPLDRILRIVNLGRVQGPYNRTNPKWKPIYVFNIRGSDSYKFMALIFPYLSLPKQEQYANALEKITALQEKRTAIKQIKATPQET